MLKKIFTSAALATISLWASAAPAANMFGVYITEFCSNSGDGLDFEFVEFTNTGTEPVDMTGWSEDDSTRVPNKNGHVLSAFGTLAPGESAIFTEAIPDEFRVYWWGSVEAAPAGLKIIGPYFNDNLSSGGDEINLYNGPNATTNLMDRLTYNGSAIPPSGGGNAAGVTRNPGPMTVLGDNINMNWVNSAIGDLYGSFAAASNPSVFGNPGSFATSTAQPGDFDGDGDVDGADFVVWQTNFPKAEGGTLDTGDADADGDVDGADFVVWQTNFPFTPSGSAVTLIPEPGSFVLMIVGIMGCAVKMRAKSI